MTQLSWHNSMYMNHYTIYPGYSHLWSGGHDSLAKQPDCVLASVDKPNWIVCECEYIPYTMCMDWVRYWSSLSSYQERQAERNQIRL